MTNLVNLADIKADRTPPSTVMVVEFVDVGGGQFVTRYETHDRGDGWHATPKEIASSLRKIADEIEP